MSDNETHVDPETGEVLEGPWGAEEEGEEGEAKTLEGMTPDDFFDGLFGTDDQLSFDLGSDYTVARSSIKIGSIPEIPARGQWKDGEKIILQIEVEVDGILFKPITTKGGARIGTERHHKARVLRCDPPPTKKTRGKK